MREDKQLKIIYSIAGILMVLSLIGSAEASTFKTGIYPGNSFVDPTVVIDVNDFSIGGESYIAPFTVFSGDYAHVGSFSNVQDSGSNSGKIRIKDNAVVAHGADLKGEVEIGSKAFIGFNSLIQDSKIGDGAYIGIRSSIIGINIPAYKSVPSGSIIDSQDDIENLLPVNREQEDFVDEVIEVNRVLAVGYTRIFEERGKDAFGKTGRHADADIIINGRHVMQHSGNHEPKVGEGTVIGNSRVIGHVILGKNVKVGEGTSIRGDEGIPIDIGDNSQIGENNTFHSLNGKQIIIGKNFNLGSESVVHGPLNIGDDVKAGNRTVLFKSNIGDGVLIGDSAVVVGVRVVDGAVVPPNSIITEQKDAKAFNDAARRAAYESKKHASTFEVVFAALVPIAFGLVGSILLRKEL